jgi:transposase
MSQPFIAGVLENPGEQAAIVFDKFCVIAHANEAVDDTRRAERTRTDKEGRELLKKARWILLKGSLNNWPQENMLPNCS